MILSYIVNREADRTRSAFAVYAFEAKIQIKIV
jgi:hypothetical protein